MIQMKKFKSSKQVYRAAVKSLLFSVMFSNTLFPKKILILGSIFLLHIRHSNLNVMWDFFSNCRNPARLHSRIHPALPMYGIDH